MTLRSNQADSAYAEIKQKVLNNVWPSGYSAFEPAVAKSLDMSRTPVREALLRLQSEGLIDLIPRRGMYVIPLAPRDMGEIYDVLAALECTAAEQLTRKNPSREELRELRLTAEDMKSALFKNDLELWAKADATFHRLLFILSENKRLIQIASTITDQAHRARMTTLRLRSKPSNSAKEHQQIISAIKEGQEELAGQLTKQHRLRGKKIILEVLEHYQLPQL